MEEKNKNQKEQELIDLDEEGKPLSIESEIKHISSKNLKQNLIIFFTILFLYLINKMFISAKRRKVFLKFKTSEDIYYNVSEVITNFIRHNPNARIGLSYGESIEGVYKHLVDKYEKGEISFKNVSFYSFDGLCGLKKDNNQSYFYAINNTFLSKIDVQRKNIFLINEGGYMLFDYENNAEEYDDILRENPIDLQILIMGENGNIGFLDQDTDYDSYSHIVKLSPEIRKKMEKKFILLENVPIYGITQGIKNIYDAKQIIVISIGKDKAKDIKILLNGVFTQKSPITALNKHSGKVTVYSDEDAGSLINETNKNF